jgi:hypothetical protein
MADNRQPDPLVKWGTRPSHAADGGVRAGTRPAPQTPPTTPPTGGSAVQSRPTASETGKSQKG